MTLSEWMAANEIGDDQLAALLRIDRSTVSRIRRGKLLPSSALIAEIMRATDGAVQPNSFFPVSPSTEAA